MSRSRRLLVVCAIALTHISLADRYRGRVVEVQDGDTFTLATEDGKRRTVRIHGIDAPEGGQAFTAEARDFLATCCLDAEVSVQVRKVDHADRLLSAVILPDGRDVALTIVENGFAWCNPNHGPVSEVLKGAENHARQNRLGLWQDPKPVPPWRWRGHGGGAIAPTGPRNLSGTVTKVSDGDTLTLTTGDGKESVVRLYGVDAPEGGRPFSEAARTFVSERCLNQAVVVQVQGGPDAHGRNVGRVTFGEGEDLGLALVAAGLAWWQPQQAPDDAILRGAEQDARGARRGLWEDENPKPPWEK